MQLNDSQSMLLSSAQNFDDALSSAAVKICLHIPSNKLLIAESILMHPFADGSCMPAAF